MHRIRGRLTYANVMSTLCFCLLVGGGSALAATQMLPKNSVGAKQLKKGAVTATKIAGSALQSLTGVAGPRGEVGPAGPQGLPGTPGTAGVPGDAKAWARVSNAGIVLASSGGVQAFRNDEGEYCVNTGAFNTSNSVAVASPDFSDSETTGGDTVEVAETSKFNKCAAGEFDVLGFEVKRDPTNLGFVIAVP